MYQNFGCQYLVLVLLSRELCKLIGWTSIPILFIAVIEYSFQKRGICSCQNYGHLCLLNEFEELWIKTVKFILEKLVYVLQKQYLLIPFLLH